MLGDAGAATLVVGVGALGVAAAVGPGARRLSTYALGSCVAAAAYDPAAGVAGLLHAMLPAASLNPARAARTPAVFVDTGVPLLLAECYRLGARRDRLVVRLAGGARLAEREADDAFRIGERNVWALRNALAQHGVAVHAEDVGGVRVARTLHLDVATGALRVRATGPGGGREYLL